LTKNRGLLKRKINDLNVKGKLDYDYIIIDTPPSLNDLTAIALVAATSVLVPLQCGFFALQVVERLLRLVRRLRVTLNPDLRMEGVLLNFYDRNTRESRRAAEEARQLFGKLVFNTVIPKNTSLGLASFESMPLLLMDAAAPGSRAFLKLAKEIMARQQNPEKIYYRQNLQSTLQPKYSILEC
ncbi:MAG: ParA family protein, partial [Calditrichia bacterium]